MDPEIINNMINKLNELKEKINQQICECRNKPKAIIIGVTGSGKSSLANVLSNREVIIKRGAGNRVELVGPGIFSGASGTKEPSIIVDNTHNIVIFDCPGFEDNEGYIQEIINSFTIHYLLKISSDTKIKILLAISANELDSARGQGVMKTIDRIVKMFPNPNQLQKGLGIVFTKGESIVTSNDFVNMLIANPKISDWFQFFKTNINNVFVFPMADPNKVGNQYDFDDHARLISFLQTNQITNLIHTITTSENATMYLENIRLNSSHKIQCTIHELFNKLSEKYRAEKSSSKLQDWLNLMNNMKSQNICQTNELQNKFPSNIPNSTNYFAILRENEIIYSFIDEILKNQNGKNDFKNTLLRSINEVINELIILKQRAQTAEENERIRIENNRILEEKRKQEEERRKRELEMQQEADRIRRENEELERKRKELERIAQQNQAQINNYHPPQGPSNEIEKFGQCVGRVFGKLF